MALLTELDKIERDSTADPGDPADAEIVAARALRAKIRIAIMMHARALLAGTRFEIAGRDPYPQSLQEINEAVGWAQTVVRNVDGALPAAFRLALLNNPDVNSNDSFATATFIRGLGTSTDYSTDENLRAALVPLLPLLAKGHHPGR